MSARQEVVMAPVSAGLAKLLHQVQAQIIRDAEERGHTARTEGTLLLPAPAHCRCEADVGRYRHFRLHDTTGYELRLQSEVGPQSDGAPPRVGIWYGSERRVDEHGQKWERYLGRHVVDDFGFLVRLPECHQ